MFIIIVCFLLRKWYLLIVLNLENIFSVMIMIRLNSRDFEKNIYVSFYLRVLRSDYISGSREEVCYLANVLGFNYFGKI